MSAPAVTDNFTQVAAAGTETTLAAPGKAIGASSINLTSPSSWPTITGIILAMRRVDSNGNYVAGTYTEWAGVLSGSTVTLNTTPLYGTDQTYAADGLTQVYIPLSYNAWNRIVNTILQQHTQAGAHVGLTNTGGANFTGGIVTDSLTVTGSNVGAGWSALGQTLTYATNNGQKEFTCTAPADLTSTLSPGMRIQVTRNTTAPTQCMAFASASSQYATKASPSGITFTATFTYETWIYLLSYSTMVIIGRSDSTAANGSQMYIDSSGRLTIDYMSSASHTTWSSYQSLPLNRWVHVAASVSSVSSKTLGGIYINGVSVPTTQTASSSTTLTQSGNLSIGANLVGGSVNNFVNGYISEARVWSVAQTQSAIQSNMAISLTGSESNLVALFQGNGNFNDKTSNANNLTANGGAVATQAANPYNNVEYAIVTKVSYSNPTTTVTLFTGTDYTIPNMTLNSAQYSLAKVPYGWPASKNKWIVDAWYTQAPMSQSSPANGTIYNIGSAQLQVPTSEWSIGFQADCFSTIGAAASITHFINLSTSNSAFGDTRLTGEGNANSTTCNTGHTRMAPTSLTALTTHYLLMKTLNSSLTAIGINADTGAATVLIAENAYA